MRMIYIVLCILSVVLSSCDLFDGTIFNKNSHVRDENYEQIACKIERKFIQKIKAERKLYCIGTGGGMMGNIQRMAMSFQYFHEVNLDEARELMVYTLKEYLAAINSSKEVRPYLKQYPFGVENVEIRIWIKEPDGHDVSLNKIDYISSIEGVLRYSIHNGLKTYSGRELHRETYEEALKIVNEQAKAS